MHVVMQCGGLFMLFCFCISLFLYVCGLLGFLGLQLIRVFAKENKC
jgi:hypothetical protein